jgi:hypothetical protein
MTMRRTTFTGRITDLEAWVFFALASMSCAANHGESAVEPRTSDSTFGSTSGGSATTHPGTTAPTGTTTPTVTTPIDTSTVTATTWYPLYDGAAFVLPGTAFADGMEVDGGAPLPIRPADHQCGMFVGPVGDIDGDGVIDVGLSCQDRASDAALLHLFTGAEVLGGVGAAFATARTEYSSSRWNQEVAAIGDVDGDGHAELGVGFDGFGGKTLTYWNGYIFGGATMSGTVGPTDAAWQVDTAGDGGPAAMVAAGDVDGDGLGDLWVPQLQDGTRLSELYLVSGAALASHPLGTYIPSPSTSHLAGEGGDPEFDDYVFAVGDVDADGLADMMVGPYKAGELRLFLGSQFPGTVTLAEAHTVVDISLPAPSFAKALPAGDHDGDGKMDVYCGLETRTGTVQIALVAGGSLAAGGLLTLADEPGVIYHEDATIRAVTACDLDGDGLNELIFRIGQPEKLHVYNGADMSSPGPVPWATVAWTSHATCLGDLNGDGRAELGLGIW